MELIDKLKNWALPILLTLFGVLEYATDFLTTFAIALDLNPKIVVYVQATMFVITSLITWAKSKKQAKEKAIAKAENE